MFMNMEYGMIEDFELRAAIAREIIGVKNIQRGTWEERMVGQSRSLEGVPVIDATGDTLFDMATMNELPFYESDIAAAWKVVEVMCGGLPNWGFCRFSVPGLSSVMRGVCVCFQHNVYPPRDIGDGSAFWGHSYECDTDAENMAFAICQAALGAIRSKGI